MTVLLPNGRLGLRRRYEGTTRDPHGDTVPTGWGSVVGPLAGYQAELPDSTWVLGLDPSLWPVRQNDMVVDGVTGGTWLVMTADLIEHPIEDSVNWIRLTANQRGNGGTEPGGAWFVNRYAPEVGPNLYRGEAELLTGHGPPPDDLPAEPGDEYLDLDSGVIYELGPG